jgi:hypothetical protein
MLRDVDNLVELVSSTDKDAFCELPYEAIGLLIFNLLEAHPIK